MLCHFHPGYWIQREIDEDGNGTVVLDNQKYVTENVEENDNTDDDNNKMADGS